MKTITHCIVAMLLLVAGGCRLLSNPVVVYPSPSTSERTVRAAFTLGGVWIPNETQAQLEVDQHNIIPCTVADGQVACVLTPEITTPWGAHLRLQIPNYETWQQDFVLNFVGTSVQFVPSADDPPNTGNPKVQALALKPLHVDPSTFTLEQLSHFRGALFTARAPLSQGPRPGQPTNVISTERAWDWWTDDDWVQAIGNYKVRGYTHIPVGPLVGDDCYHGVYRPCNQALDEGARDRFLDFVQRLWDNGLIPVYRHKPDNWETPAHAADLQRLDELMSTDRAQRLLRVVTYAGWEPNGGAGLDANSKYGWTNATYVAMLSRGARVFPNALRTLHTTCDTEVPVGGDTEDPALTVPGVGFARAWHNILPYIHVWEQQVCGYVDGGSEKPTPDFLVQLKWVLQNQPPRTAPGGMWYGGQTAWGPNTRLTWVLSEWSSYRDFWQDWPEDQARTIGDFAVCNGADGYFDGGTVSVPPTDEERQRVCH